MWHVIIDYSLKQWPHSHLHGSRQESCFKFKSTVHSTNCISNLQINNICIEEIELMLTTNICWHQVLLQNFPTSLSANCTKFRTLPLLIYIDREDFSTIIYYIKEKKLMGIIIVLLHIITILLKFHQKTLRDLTLEYSWFGRKLNHKQKPQWYTCKKIFRQMKKTRKIVY